MSSFTYDWFAEPWAAILRRCVCAYMSVCLIIKCRSTWQRSQRAPCPLLPVCTDISTASDNKVWFCRPLFWCDAIVVWANSRKGGGGAGPVHEGRARPSEVSWCSCGWSAGISIQERMHLSERLPQHVQGRRCDQMELAGSCEISSLFWAIPIFLQPSVSHSFF